MDFIALLGELKAKIEAIEAEIEAIKKEQYDLGFEAGKAQAGVVLVVKESIEAVESTEALLKQKLGL